MICRWCDKLLCVDLQNQTPRTDGPAKHRAARSRARGQYGRLWPRPKHKVEAEKAGARLSSAHQEGYVRLRACYEASLSTAVVEFLDKKKFWSISKAGLFGTVLAPSPLVHQLLDDPRPTRPCAQPRRSASASKRRS